jgi:hypothetical protein
MILPYDANLGRMEYSEGTGTDANSKEPHAMNLTVAAWLSAAIIAFCLIAVAGGFLMGAGII